MERLAEVPGLGVDSAQQIIADYPIANPDPTQSQDVEVCSHPEVWETYQALAGRAMDGGALLQYLLADPGHHPYDGISGIGSGDTGALDNRAQRFVAWAARFLTVPGSSADDAWVPDHLDYQFAASAPLPDGSEKVYVASDYSAGQLDWYSLDLVRRCPFLQDFRVRQRTEQS